MTEKKQFAKISDFNLDENSKLPFSVYIFFPLSEKYILVIKTDEIPTKNQANKFNANSDRLFTTILEWNAYLDKTAKNKSTPQNAITPKDNTSNKITRPNAIETRIEADTSQSAPQNAIPFEQNQVISQASESELLKKSSTNTSNNNSKIEIEDIKQAEDDTFSEKFKFDRIADSQENENIESLVDESDNIDEIVHSENDANNNSDHVVISRFEKIQKVAEKFEDSILKIQDLAIQATSQNELWVNNQLFSKMLISPQISKIHHLTYYIDIIIYNFDSNGRESKSFREFCQAELPRIIKKIDKKLDESIDETDRSTSEEKIASLSELNKITPFHSVIFDDLNDFISKINNSVDDQNDLLAEIVKKSDTIQSKLVEQNLRLDEILNYIAEDKKISPSKSIRTNFKKISEIDTSDIDDEFVFSLEKLEECIQIVNGKHQSENIQKITLRDAGRPAVLEYKRIVVASHLAKAIQLDQKELLQMLESNKSNSEEIKKKNKNIESMRALMGIIKNNPDLDPDKNQDLKLILEKSFNDSHLDRDISAIVQNIEHMQDNLINVGRSVFGIDEKIEKNFASDQPENEFLNKKIVRQKENLDYAFCSFTAQLAISIGYNHKNFVTDTAIAGLFKRNNNDGNLESLSEWTKILLAALDDLDFGWDYLSSKFDSTTLNCLQIIFLTNEYLKNYYSPSSTLRIEPDKFSLLTQKIEQDPKWHTVDFSFFNSGVSRPHTPDRSNFYFEVASETKKIIDKLPKAA